MTPSGRGCIERRRVARASRTGQRHSRRARTSRPLSATGTGGFVLRAWAMDRAGPSEERRLRSRGGYGTGTPCRRHGRCGAVEIRGSYRTLAHSQWETRRACVTSIGRRRVGGSNPSAGTISGFVLNHRCRSPLCFSNSTHDKGGTDLEQAVRNFRQSTLFCLCLQRRRGKVGRADPNCLGRIA